MNKYVSILRGINVSGLKKIKMADLKRLYEQLGFENVLTYIQSGNVIFESPSGNKATIKNNIETAIKEAYNFDVPVKIKTGLEIQNIIKTCPFKDLDIEKDGTKVLVTFLYSNPPSTVVINIKKYVVTPEVLIVKGTEVYLYCPNGYGKSKLSNTYIEKKLGVVATTRNWKTVLKLDTLSN